MVSGQTFPMRYGLFKPLLWALGAGPGSSSVTLGDEVLRVRMGWVFRAEVPVGSIAAARPDTRFVGGIGVHGWRGSWLVNGAASGLVAIEIDPPTRGRVTGVPVRLRQLRVSVESPGALIAALVDGGLVDGGVDDHGEQH